MPSSCAHAKAIIVGEHSVLYGSCAIAAPLPGLKIEVDCSPTIFESSVNTDGFCGRLRDLPANFSGISLVASRLLGAHCANLHFKSSIPQGAGLGSSAASALALARSLNCSLSLGLGAEEVMRISSEAEDAVHGKASGLDLAACAASVPILFSSSSATSLPPLGAALLVVYSGEAGRTQSAIKKVASCPKKGKIMEGLSEACLRAKDGWGDLEEVGRAMSCAQGMLRDLGLSTPKLENIVGRCEDLGALGAKLTGSGLGGCAIGLFRDGPSAKAARRAFPDFDTWVEEV